MWIFLKSNPSCNNKAPVTESSSDMMSIVKKEITMTAYNVATAFTLASWFLHVCNVYKLHVYYVHV